MNDVTLSRPLPWAHGTHWNAPQNRARSRPQAGRIRSGILPRNGIYVKGWPAELDRYAEARRAAAASSKGLVPEARQKQEPCHCCRRRIL